MGKQILIDKHISHFTEAVQNKRPGVLFSIKGAITGWAKNRNGRTYSRNLWDKAINSEFVKGQVALKHFVGEVDHPEDRLEPVIQGMSHAVRDFEFDDRNNELLATIDILDCPNGQLLKTLYDYSGSLCFSTRGSGDVLDGGEVDEDSYELFAVDAVLLPSWQGSVITTLTESTLIESIKEAKKNVLTESQAKDLLEKYSKTDTLSEQMFLLNHPKYRKSLLD